MFVTLGERFYARDEAQNPASDLGKLVRLMPDGSPYAANPKRDGWRPEIWSIGHRNVQGAAIHPATGKLWTIEHGARGGDEINIPEAGKNYGWPVISYGRNYDGTKIGIGTEKAGMEQPIYYWDPVIAPSGAIVYTGKAFPAWRGSLLISGQMPQGLTGGDVTRLTVKNEKVTGEERLGLPPAYYRDIRQGPDGAIWLLTGGPAGQVLKLTPKPAR